MVLSTVFETGKEFYYETKKKGKATKIIYFWNAVLQTKVNFREKRNCKQ